MSIRKDPLSTGQYYHIFNRSIAGYKIFNRVTDYKRFLDGLVYYQSPKSLLKFSRFLELSDKNKQYIFTKRENPSVDIVAYCIMPTHFHLLLHQNIDGGISDYLRMLQNSYSHYFNIKLIRYGHLWQGKFKNTRVESNEQLLHLTRYIHLNPTSAGLVEKPQDWQWSSYSEYLAGEESICRYKNITDLSPKEFKKFVIDRKDYQREISKIKSMLIDYYAG